MARGRQSKTRRSTGGVSMAEELAQHGGEVEVPTAVVGDQQVKPADPATDDASEYETPPEEIEDSETDEAERTIDEPCPDPVEGQAEDAPAAPEPAKDFEPGCMAMHIHIGQVYKILDVVPAGAPFMRGGEIVQKRYLTFEIAPGVMHSDPEESFVFAGDSEAINTCA